MFKEIIPVCSQKDTAWANFCVFNLKQTINSHIHGVHCAGLSDVHGASQYVVPRDGIFFSASGAALPQKFRRYNECPISLRSENPKVTRVFCGKVIVGKPQGSDTQEFWASVER
jgi:hypothetical protein